MVRKERQYPRLTYYEKGPGPAGYSLPPLIGRPKHAVTHRINPEFSFGNKLKSSFVPRGIGPGPGAFGIPYGLKAKGYDAGFSYTIRQRFDQIDKRRTPGPGAYLPELINKPKAPAFTMRIRHRQPTRPQTPGPNLYKLPPMLGPKVQTRLAAPECTFKGLRKDKDVKPSTPGPRYDVGRLELIKQKAPGFSMRIKWPEIKSQSCKAGPADYDINGAKIFPKNPKWPFGIRYNDFTGIMKTECDKLRYENFDDC